MDEMALDFPKEIEETYRDLLNKFDDLQMGLSKLASDTAEEILLTAKEIEDVEKEMGINEEEYHGKKTNRL